MHRGETHRGLVYSVKTPKSTQRSKWPLFENSGKGRNSKIFKIELVLNENSSTQTSYNYVI